MAKLIYSRVYVTRWLCCGAFKVFSPPAGRVFLRPVEPSTPAFP
jgi:hypothetical protein